MRADGGLDRVALMTMVTLVRWCQNGRRPLIRVGGAEGGRAEPAAAGGITAAQELRPEFRCGNKKNVGSVLNTVQTASALLKGAFPTRQHVGSVLNMVQTTSALLKGALPIVLVGSVASTMRKTSALHKVVVNSVFPFLLLSRLVAAPHQI